MRIVGPSGPTAAKSTPAARRTGSGTFTLPTEATTAPAAGSAVRGLAGIDALMALQGVESPEERRRRAIGRGRTALDALDALKVAFLSGLLDEDAVGRLRAAVAGLKDPTGDPRLDGLMAEIELRVAVELAKMDRPTT
jgi:hypothetical protein